MMGVGKMGKELELLPCPFCGEAPELPSGYGTQYRIECGGCGQAMAGVLICDLMTLEERAAETFTYQRYGEQFVERAKLKAFEYWNERCAFTVPEGYALVPVEPTRAMIDAALRDDCIEHDPRSIVYADYRAMIAAAQQAAK
jgi:hypothetical protein